MTKMMTSPVALFVNCLDAAAATTDSALSPRAAPSTLLTDFPHLTSSSVAEGRPSSPRWPNSQSWKWTIDNKYYVADIDVVAIPSPLLPGVSNPTTLDADGLSSRVEALILCFGGDVGGLIPTTSFNLVEHWKPFVDRFSPPVRLLVCETIGDEEGDGHATTKSRGDVIAWCIENQFELVLLDGDEDDDDDEDDDEDEDDDSHRVGRPFASGEFGVPRIVAALQAHMWSNLNMKENRAEAAGGGGGIGDEEKSRKKEKPEKNEQISVVNDDHLKDLFENINLAGDIADDEEESFEQLFNKMAHLKSQSQNLPFEERKAFAEQVTMAFWRSIGGAEDELDGLDDDL